MGTVLKLELRGRYRPARFAAHHCADLPIEEDFFLIDLLLRPVT
jgi:hypothetical protein